MAWSNLNQTMREAMIQFVEPNPPANSHGNISLKYISFYSSELKNLTQLVSTLDQISQGKMPRGRCQNALKKMLREEFNMK